MANLLIRFFSGLTWFLSGYAGVVVVLYILSTVTEYAGFAARVLASWISLVGCALFGVVSSIALRLSGGSRYQNSQWLVARAFKYTMALTTGVTFVVSDPNHYLTDVRPAVFIANHQTALDVLMLGCMFPQYCSVTAKRQLRNYPFLGWFMQLSGSIFLDRSNSKGAREAMKGAADSIVSRRQSVYMFPEGTRSGAQEPMLLPFKKGAFHLAVQAGVPIVPVVVSNYSHLYSTSKFRFRSGQIPVRVLEPIHTKGLTADDVTDLTNQTRGLMLQELVSLTAEARRMPSAPIQAASSATSSATAEAPINEAVSSAVEVVAAAS